MKYQIFAQKEIFGACTKPVFKPQTISKQAYQDFKEKYEFKKQINSDREPHYLYVFYRESFFRKRFILIDEFKSDLLLI